MSGCTIAGREARGPSSGLLPEEVLQLLRKLGLGGKSEIPPGAALSGGVSSDIWRVELAGGPVCVKRALPPLRVAQVWGAPIERNPVEYEWFPVAGKAAPHALPQGGGPQEGLFVLAYP